MVLDPNNDRGQQIDGVSEKGQEYQAVRIFGKDSLPDCADTAAIYTSKHHIYLILILMHRFRAFICLIRNVKNSETSC